MGEVFWLQTDLYEKNEELREIQDRWIDGVETTENVILHLQRIHRRSELSTDDLNQLMRYLRNHDLQDSVAHIRVNMGTPTNISEAIFAIDGRHTTVADDCISFNPDENRISVYITDVAHFFDNDQVFKHLHEDAYERAISWYLPHALFSMIPRQVQEEKLSFSGNGHTGLSICFSFSIAGNGSVHHPNVRCTRIPPPIVLTYDQVNNSMLHMANQTVLPPHQCAGFENKCTYCLGFHFRSMYNLLLKLQNFRKLGCNNSSTIQSPEEIPEDVSLPLRVVRVLRGRPVVDLCRTMNDPVPPRENLARFVVSESMTAANHVAATFANQNNLEVIYSHNFIQGYRVGLTLNHNNIVGLYGYCKVTSPCRRVIDFYNQVLIKIGLQWLHERHVSNSFSSQSDLNDPVNANYRNAVRQIQANIGHEEDPQEESEDAFKDEIIETFHLIDERERLVKRYDEYFNESNKYFYFQQLGRHKTRCRQQIRILSIANPHRPVNEQHLTLFFLAMNWEVENVLYHFRTVPNDGIEVGQNREVRIISSDSTSWELEVEI